MAKSVTISTFEKVAEVAIDGNKVSDVISYSLTEDSTGARLLLEVLITGSVEVQR